MNRPSKTIAIAPCVQHRTKFNLFLAGAAVALTLTVPATASPIAGQGTWETTLHARDLDGNGSTDAFYDSTLKITWLRDANVNRGVDYGGMNWYSANTWALGLTINGYSDWRLPMVRDLTNEICKPTNDGSSDCGWNVRTTSGSVVYSELASLFFDTLGNIAICAPSATLCQPPKQVGSGLKNTGDFVDFFETFYWSSDEFTGNYSSPNAWAFHTGDGYQGVSNKQNPKLAMVVHPGDIGIDVGAAQLPEPQSWVIALTALVGLAVSRRRSTKQAYR